MQLIVSIVVQHLHISIKTKNETKVFFFKADIIFHSSHPVLAKTVMATPASGRFASRGSLDLINKCDR